MNGDFSLEDWDNYLGIAIDQIFVDNNDFEVRPFLWSRNPNNSIDEISRLKEFIKFIYDNNKDKKIAVVAHSWGTVLSYVALTNMDRYDISIDLFVTLGSPLGTAYYSSPFPDWVAIKDYVSNFLSQNEFCSANCNPPVKRWVNFWNKFDVISGPINQRENMVEDVQFDDDVSLSEGLFGKLMRNLIGSNTMHFYNSLSLDSELDNSKLRNRARDLLLSLISQNSANSSGNSGNSPEMVFVQGGTFEMGSANGDSDEKPTYTVTVDDFYIGKYEVTFEEFKSFIESTSYKTDAEKKGWSFIIYDGIYEKKKGTTWRDDEKGNKLTSSDNNKPVIHVSWNDAIAYCNWLSSQEGLEKFYNINGNNVTMNWRANGYRLPTEAEWEYAARGGNKSRGYKYSGSNNINDVAWYESNSGGRTHEVGAKQPNELGIYDMSGNVWEWCNDWFDKNYYSNSTRKNPKGASRGSYRVGRGGSWSGTPYRCKVATRDDSEPSRSYNIVGIRIAKASNSANPKYFEYGGVTMDYSEGVYDNENFYAADYSEIIHLLKDNIEALNNKNFEKYMSTIHPESPFCNSTASNLNKIFKLDLHTKLKVKKIIYKSRNICNVIFNQKTFSGNYLNNEIEASDELRKYHGDWKIYNTIVISIVSY